MDAMVPNVRERKEKVGWGEEACVVRQTSRGTCRPRVRASTTSAGSLRPREIARAFPEPCICAYMYI